LTQFKGYLDRLRENVEALDEAIATTRAKSKSKKGGDSRTVLQWTKTLRDLIELRNTTLEKVKVHLLGRDESGASNEPGEEDNGAVLFERRFRGFLMEPWTVERLNLTCQDCGSERRDVWERSFYKKSESMGWETERLWLCPECDAKREATQPTKEQLEEEEE